jgi:hypothetical protein
LNQQKPVSHPKKMALKTWKIKLGHASGRVYFSMNSLS